MPYFKLAITREDPRSAISFALLFSCSANLNANPVNGGVGDEEGAESVVDGEESVGPVDDEDDEPVVKGTGDEEEDDAVPGFKDVFADTDKGGVRDEDEEASPGFKYVFADMDNRGGGDDDIPVEDVDNNGTGDDGVPVVGVVKGVGDEEVTGTDEGATDDEDDEPVDAVIGVGLGPLTHCMIDPVDREAEPDFVCAGSSPVMLAF